MAVSHGWVGAVTTTTATVKARSDQSSATATTDPSTSTFNGSEGNDDVFTFSLTGLTANTSYEVTVDDGNGTWVATFKTAPSGAASFTFALAGDSGHSGGTYDSAGVSPTAPTWLSIAEDNPDFLVFCGDLHYKDINSTTASLYYNAFKAVIADNCQTMLQSVPIAYVWDDHDFCGNDSVKTATGRTTVAAAYRTYVPHYPLEDSVGIWQWFKWGRVLFILADGRSSKDVKATADTPSKSMLGSTQKAWLESVLDGEGGDAGLIVFLPGATWHVAPSAGSDSWAGYTNERRELSQMFTRFGVNNKLLIVCADAHMLAYDDGTNTKYDPNSGERGPRLIHCGKVDAGTVNLGGPYTSGIHNESNQMYFTVDITDDGTNLDVTVHGWSAPLGEETEVITASFRAGHQVSTAGKPKSPIVAARKRPRIGWL